MYKSINYILDILRKKGFDVNAHNPEIHNITALHVAAFYGDIDIVKYIIQYTGNHSPKDDYRSTPLHYAVLGKNIDVVKELLLLGADYTEVDSNNFDALNYSIRNNYDDITNVIIKHAISLMI